MRDRVLRQRADFAKAVTNEGEAALLYANRPDYTEQMAEALISEQQPPRDVDPEILELVDFLRTDVHPEYPLIATLPHGVAFHYGYMPAIVRARVEDLFRSGKLKFVCCTSTLLQGVNLPARHIIIEDPKCGSAPMERGQFRNLAGRAGRLLQEFHGTVWCIRPMKWEKQAFDGFEPQPMTTSFDMAMADGGTVIREVISGSATGDDIDVGEAAFGKLYCDYIRGGSPLADLHVQPESQASLQQTIVLLESLEITLPTEVLDVNRSVRPDRLQELYEHLKSYTSLDRFLPIRPGIRGATDRMGEIIQLVQEKLQGTTNNSHKFYKWLATQWIFNEPLGEIISRRIGFRRSQGDTRPASTIIRELLNTLENEIRYRLVKHYVAYTSVLAHVLRERGMETEAETLEPFHVYLECGASNRVALSLIALGLSRNTALAVGRRVVFPDDASPEDCLALLLKVDVATINIPRVCIRELDDLLLPLRSQA